MPTDTHEPAGRPTQAGFWRTRTGVAFGIFAVALAAYLLFSHTAHVFQWLPFGLILLCPLMHVFMHGGHNHGGGGKQ
ncbi:DUF2933 domain-containing protein [Roseomonas eburnea]|uniref:DUF2933 domain-containing protein n=1 Tax=Neoroseomonas eburnea TaxID=1346889 RepID=A0A9X9XGS5_9PROT|nr:DUF2933 domain-containing protein [Neoroseomonas eburnea]MBR0682911.1 DUF2933 domain-containing protein [Neoroseomonas eburnea]